MNAQHKNNIEDIFISRNRRFDLFFITIPAGLWRLHTIDDIEKLRHALYPLFRPVNNAEGNVTRSADIKVYSVDGVPYVEAGTGGVSLFDDYVDLHKPGNYYYAEKGAEIPKGLAVSKDRYNSRLKAVHYTIHPAHDMPVIRCVHLLRNYTKQFTHTASTIRRSK